MLLSLWCFGIHRKLEGKNTLEHAFVKASTRLSQQLILLQHDQLIFVSGHVLDKTIVFFKRNILLSLLHKVLHRCDLFE